MGEKTYKIKQKAHVDRSFKPLEAKIKKILKTAIEKILIHRRIKMRHIKDFLSKNIQDRRQWRDILKVLKETNS